MARRPSDGWDAIAEGAGRSGALRHPSSLTMAIFLAVAPDWQHVACGASDVLRLDAVAIVEALDLAQRTRQVVDRELTVLVALIHCRRPREHHTATIAPSNTSAPTRSGSPPVD